MKRTRESLDKKIREVSGFNNVYFQAPSKMSYPCIRYDRDNIDTDYANDIRYKNKTKYIVTLIGKEADNMHLVNKLLDSFMYMSYDRQYKSDTLYHDVMILYW